MDDDPLIGLREMDRRSGVAPGTTASYRHKYRDRPDRFPPPDDTTVPGRPRWRLSTYRRWRDSRPGRGARTDLTPPRRCGA